jgi:membrane protein required for beta-lactamase induction
MFCTRACKKLGWLSRLSGMSMALPQHHFDHVVAAWHLSWDDQGASQEYPTRTVKYAVYQLQFRVHAALWHLGIWHARQSP